MCGCAHPVAGLLHQGPELLFAWESHRDQARGGKRAVEMTKRGGKQLIRAAKHQLAKWCSKQHRGASPCSAPSAEGSIQSWHWMEQAQGMLQPLRGQSLGPAPLPSRQPGPRPRSQSRGATGGSRRCRLMDNFQPAACHIWFPLFPKTRKIRASEHHQSLSRLSAESGKHSGGFRAEHFPRAIRSPSYSPCAAIPHNASSR